MRRLLTESVASRIATRRGTRLRPTLRRADAFGAKAGPTGALWTAVPGAALTRAQKDWVSRGGALTAHLAQFGKVTVRVVDEAIRAPWPDEVMTMASYGESPKAPFVVWTRDIVLHIDGLPCVAAHSITPLDASRADWKAMRALRTRPLADLLYADRTVRRSLLLSRRAVGRRDPLYRLAERAIATSLQAEPLVARRSLFERRRAPLLITECFLPDFWALISRTPAL